MNEAGYRNLWRFRRAMNVNHGSFGATPLEIRRRQAAMRDAFDDCRDDFIFGEAQALIAAGRARVAGFIGADPADVVFVDNATDGFNAVLKSVSLGPGDAVLYTSHIYSNFPPVLGEEAARRGFELVTAAIPYPPRSAEEIVAAVLAKVHPGVRLAVIDHITSPTAVLFPVREIVAALAERGIDTFIDGAHAPGQVAVDVGAIGAAYYTGNHHKWLCAPVASGFLHVRRDRQDAIMPAAGSGDACRDVAFDERFSWTGTRDLTPRLLVADTIDYMASLHPDGWDGIMRRNHELAVRAQALFHDRLGTEPAYSSALFGSMVTVPLGALRFDEETEALAPTRRLHHMLDARAGMSACAIPFGGTYLLRLSCHLYNGDADYEGLADAVADLVREL